MLETLLIVLLGLTPWLLSFWVLRKAEAQARERIRSARLAIATHSTSPDLTVSDRQYIEGVGYLIGDITCQFNARSAYIRCAVNPHGPCQGCPSYEPRTIDFHP